LALRHPASPKLETCVPKKYRARRKLFSSCLMADRNPARE
jgi:hypothetical protein